MNPEKLLPPGEPEAQVTLDGGMRIHRKPVQSPPRPFVPETASTPAQTPAPATSSVIARPPLPGVPSPEAQQWGVVISIVIIVLMIIIGAFYAWGERIAQNQYPAAVTE